jgi:transposase
MSKRDNLTDAQWAIIEPLIPEQPTRADGRGRPWRDNREILDGVIWILRSGARWKDIPREYPPYQTCHRRLQQWVKDGTLRSILETLAKDLHECGKIDLEECFIDGSFVGAKKGGSGIGKTKRGKGTKLMAIADAHGIPIAIHTTSASPHEVTLVEETLEQNLLADAPERLIGDGAYDSDPLDDKLKEAGIKLIAPHRRNRVSPPTQDGREFRRYKRRWKIERLFAWLHNYRRLVIRWEYKLENFTGFINLGCILIVLRYL